MLKFFFLLILYIPLFCQYSFDDKELVKTTFYRQFNREIISKYLQSDEPEQVKAGLLSISHSEDTTFIDDITRLDFQKYGSNICFALGELGACKKSAQFLLSSLTSYSNYSRDMLDALGKTGTQQTLNDLIEEYQSSGNALNGIALALVNFKSRGIQVPVSKNVALLQNEIRHHTGQRLLDALYALYRVGPDSTITGDLLKILDYNGMKEEDIFKIQYILGSFRKLEYFPGIPLLLEKLLSHPDWRIRTEAAKCACFYNYTKEEELNKYLNLFKDANPGVTRQAAISLSSMKLKYPLNDKLKEWLQQAFRQPGSYTANTLGELFLSYIKLNKNEIFDFINKQSNKVEFKFLCEALKNNTENPQSNFDYLKSKYYATRNMDRMYAADALLSFQDALRDNNEYAKMLLDNFGSSFPPVVSVTAEGLDSAFIKKYSSELKDKLNNFFQKQIDNNIFAEAILSSARLAQRMDENFYKLKLNTLKFSRTVVVQNFALGELKQPVDKQDDNFEKIWEDAFNYSSAKIVTDKGEFKIKLLPEYAPISAGNFCYLALQNFFNGITIHRVVPDFVIQTGDKTGTGWGGPGYEIVSEFSPLPFDKGYVGMASSGKDTEGSQWFVMHSSYPHLNGKYSNFGRVISGMNVVNIIDEGDKIIRVDLED